jgi:hypothetical protein
MTHPFWIPSPLKSNHEKSSLKIQHKKLCPTFQNIDQQISSKIFHPQKEAHDGKYEP